LFERARLLDRLGRSDDARQGYVTVLQRDPAHFGALNDLGMLLYKAGRGNEALTCFNAAVAKHPNNAIGHANLAFVLLRGGEAQLARDHYQAALQLDPKNAETHRGLALALDALGRSGEAKVHADAGFAMQPLVQLPFRGGGKPVRLSLLVSAGAGNVPIERVLDDRVFAISKIVVDYVPDDLRLPPADVIFNAIGDADLAPASLQRAAAIVARAASPVVNAPDAVQQTGRVAMSRRLSGIDDLTVPHIEAIPRDAFADAASAARELTARGFEAPFLLRAPGYHTGAHFERVDAMEAAASIAAKLPGDELFAIEYVDLRGPDGSVRKYRAMIAGEELLPLHLAVSPHWKVHYFSAEMTESAEHRGEDEAFLRDMEGVLGARVMTVLETIRRRSGLDYGGIDFSIDREGRAVLFEANATMIVPAAGEDARWAYRREPVERIERAVRAMIRSRASARDALTP
jgi:hypothetical protein